MNASRFFQGAEWRATSETGGITGITSKGCNQLQQTGLELRTDFLGSVSEGKLITDASVK